MVHKPELPCHIWRRNELDWSAPCIESNSHALILPQRVTWYIPSLEGKRIVPCGDDVLLVNPMHAEYARMHYNVLAKDLWHHFSLPILCWPCHGRTPEVLYLPVTASDMSDMWYSRSLPAMVCLASMGARFYYLRRRGLGRAAS